MSDALLLMLPSVVTQAPVIDQDEMQTAVDIDVADVSADSGHLGSVYSSSSPENATLNDAFFLEDVPFSTAVFGYVAPFIIAVTVVTNLLVCLVLIRPGMRTATNAVLVAVAFSDSMTGLAPLPCYIYFYTLGGQHDWVPYRWCFLYFCLIDYVPTVFHTASVWLTVLLAAQRYVCVCRGDLPRARTARRRSVVVKVIDRLRTYFSEAMRQSHKEKEDARSWE
jgi:Serpentine type 7TM GPCR chemoreceptor Srw